MSGNIATVVIAKRCRYSILFTKISELKSTLEVWKSYGPVLNACYMKIIDVCITYRLVVCGTAHIRVGSLMC